MLERLGFDHKYYAPADDGGQGSGGIPVLSHQLASLTDRIAQLPPIRTPGGQTLDKLLLAYIADIRNDKFDTKNLTQLEKIADSLSSPQAALFASLIGDAFKDCVSVIRELVSIVRQRYGMPDFTKHLPDELAKLHATCDDQVMQGALRELSRVIESFSSIVINPDSHQRIQESDKLSDKVRLVLERTLPRFSTDGRAAIINLQGLGTELINFIDAFQSVEQAQAVAKYSFLLLSTLRQMDFVKQEWGSSLPSIFDQFDAVAKKALESVPIKYKRFDLKKTDQIECVILSAFMQMTQLKGVKTQQIGPLLIMRAPSSTADHCPWKSFDRESQLRLLSESMQSLSLIADPNSKRQELMGLCRGLEDFFALCCEFNEERPFDQGRPQARIETIGALQKQIYEYIEDSELSPFFKAAAKAILDDVLVLRYASQS